MISDGCDAAPWDGATPRLRPLVDSDREALHAFTGELSFPPCLERQEADPLKAFPRSASALDGRMRVAHRSPHLHTRRVRY